MELNGFFSWYVISALFFEQAKRDNIINLPIFVTLLMKGFTRHRLSMMNK